MCLLSSVVECYLCVAGIDKNGTGKSRTTPSMFERI